MKRILFVIYAVLTTLTLSAVGNTKEKSADTQINFGYSACDAESAPELGPVEIYGRRALTYKIVRKGREIGSHQVQFDSIPGGFQVQAQTRIRVYVLFVPVFSYDYTSQEVWCGQSLIEVTTEVTENGNRRQLHIDSNSAQWPDLAEVFTTNHWNPRVIDASSAFNTITGNLVEFQVLSHDKEWVPSGEGVRKAMRYQLTGELLIEVWYDAEGRWSKLRFKDSGGEYVEFICVQCGAMPA